MNHLFVYEKDKHSSIYLRVINTKKIRSIVVFDIDRKDAHATVVMDDGSVVKMGLFDYGRLLAEMTRK